MEVNHADRMLWDAAVSSLARGALALAVVLGAELTAPLGGFAQPNTEPASTPAASVQNQDPPPIQKAEVIEEPTLFYKKWWFWVLVGVVVVFGALAAVVASDPPSPGFPGPP
jgi:hypothetical protein